MKEYTYEVQHSWEKQRRTNAVDNQHRQQQHHHRRHHHQHHRCYGKDDTAIDADASSMSEMRIFVSRYTDMACLVLRQKQKEKLKSILT
ncbi:unnamed protein product [Rotaria sordida]|uniref:Uncharacterized protein n=1 Tax=Rotaria sordida TaxID=392033 RepID=A0A815EBP6_9BILA|nr:unnamed protein product [Rotaria sordida]CAF3848845.1 unnamed protein product [Rotaria sordida]